MFCLFFHPEHQKMCYTALVLTMIFSMGEQVPYHHYGMINLSLLWDVLTWPHVRRMEWAAAKAKENICLQSILVPNLFGFCWAWWRTGFPLIPLSSCRTSSWTSCWPLTCITQVRNWSERHQRTFFSAVWHPCPDKNKIIHTETSFRSVVFLCLNYVSVSTSAEQQCNNGGVEAKKRQGPDRKSAATPEQRR